MSNIKYFDFDTASLTMEYSTPKGVARFPKLNKPDPTYGGYSVGLVLDPELTETKALVAQIMAAHKLAVDQVQAAASVAFRKTKAGQAEGAVAPAIKVVAPPVCPETDRDGNETGRIVVKFKAKELVGKKGEERPNKPRLVDSKNKPLNAAREIGGGSVIRCTGKLNLYSNASVGTGVGLRLYAVQVIKLVERKPDFEQAEGYEEGVDGDSDGDSPVSTKPVTDGTPAKSGAEF